MFPSSSNGGPPPWNSAPAEPRSPVDWQPCHPSRDAHREVTTSNTAEALRAIQALGELVHQELKVAHDRCNALQDAMSDNVMAPVHRAGQQVADLDAKVLQLVGETQDCSSRVEEHEVRLGVTRSKLDAHEQRITLLSDRLDRVLRNDVKGLRNASFLSMTLDSAAGQDNLADISELKLRLVECEKRLGFSSSKGPSALHHAGQSGSGGSAASTPRSRHRSSEGAEGHATAASQWSQIAAADAQQPATVALRLARCEQTSASLRAEFAERTSELTDRIQASFQDLRAHLEAVSGQMTSLKEGVHRSEALLSRVDGLEVRMSDNEGFAGSLQSGFEALHKLLLEVKSSMDAALLERRERLRSMSLVHQTGGGGPLEEIAINAAVQRRLDELAIKVGSLPGRLLVLEERTGKSERGVGSMDERTAVLRSDMSQLQVQAAATAAELSKQHEGMRNFESISTEFREAITQQQFELARLAEIVDREATMRHATATETASRSRSANAIGREDGGAEAGGGGSAPSSAATPIGTMSTAEAEASGGGGGGGGHLHGATLGIVTQSHVAQHQASAAPLSSQHDVGVAEVAGGGAPPQQATRRSPVAGREDVSTRGLDSLPSSSTARPTRRRTERAEASGGSSPSGASRTAGAEAGGGAPFGGFAFSVDYNGPETSAGIPRRGGAEAGGGPSPSQAEQLDFPLVGTNAGASGASSPRGQQQQQPQLGSTHSPVGVARHPAMVASRFEGDGAAGGAPAAVPPGHRPEAINVSTYRGFPGDDGGGPGSTAASSAGGDADEGGGEGAFAALERLAAPSASAGPAAGRSHAANSTSPQSATDAPRGADAHTVLEEMEPTLLAAIGDNSSTSIISEELQRNPASSSVADAVPPPPSRERLAESQTQRATGFSHQVFTDDEEDDLDIDVLPDDSMMWGPASGADGARISASSSSSSEEGTLAARVAERLRSQNASSSRPAVEEAPDSSDMAPLPRLSPAPREVQITEVGTFSEDSIEA